MLRYEGFKREVVNLPNMITIGRLFLIPPVLLLVDPADPVRSMFAGLLFGLASALDFLDGWLARRQGLVTVFGKFVDPLADKIMVMAVLVYLVEVGSVPAVLVVLLLGREFYISGLRLVASSEGVVIAAGSGGKAKTVLQLVGICLVLARYSYRLPFMDFYFDLHAIGITCIYVSLAFSIASGVQYTLDFGRALRGAKEEG